MYAVWLYAYRVTKSLSILFECMLTNMNSNNVQYVISSMISINIQPCDYNGQICMYEVIWHNIIISILLDCWTTKTVDSFSLKDIAM